jgi:hypothetical protein
MRWMGPATVGSARKGGKKLCQRRLINEPLLVTKLALNLSWKVATFTQPCRRVIRAIGQRTTAAR